MSKDNNNKKRAPHLSHVTPPPLNDLPHVPKEVGVKYDAGKPAFDLIPPLPLLEVAQLYAVGATKYGIRNWERGMKWSRIFAAMIRHAFKWWAGELRDKEDGQHHLAAVVWNALALMEFERTHPELDDRNPENIPLCDK